jgi:hypothetical protein
VCRTCEMTHVFDWDQPLDLFDRKTSVGAYDNFVEERACRCVLCGAKQSVCRTVGYLALCLGLLVF